jgi:hypothetical protein
MSTIHDDCRLHNGEKLRNKRQQRARGQGLDFGLAFHQGPGFGKNPVHKVVAR